MLLFFKQKTAYEMRVSDWSSDVCSSDLQCTLRRAEPVVGLPAGDGERQRRRIGHPDIRDGETGEAARDIARVLAAVEHAREPGERRIHVRAAQRLVQRAGEVVVPLLALVVEGRAALDRRREGGRVE